MDRLAHRTIFTYIPGANISGHPVVLNGKVQKPRSQGAARGSGLRRLPEARGQPLIVRNRSVL